MVLEANEVTQFPAQEAPQPRPFLEERHELIQEFERKYVTRLLTLTRGNVSEAARKAGVSRQALYGLFKRHNIDPRQFSRSSTVG